jgi:hypothetical protein
LSDDLAAPDRSHSRLGAGDRIRGGPVAEQAGHSIATLAKHYAGVIRELENAPRKPAAEAILEARKRP